MSRQQMVQNMREFLKNILKIKASLRTPLVGIDPICMRCKKQDNPNDMTIDSYIRCGCCDDTYHRQCYQAHQKQSKQAHEKPLNRNERAFMNIYLKKIMEAVKDDRQEEKEVVEDQVPRPETQKCTACEKGKCMCIFLYDTIRKKKKEDKQ